MMLDYYAKELATLKFRMHYAGGFYLIRASSGECRSIPAGNANTIWANAGWPKSQRKRIEWLWIYATPSERHAASGRSTAPRQGQGAVVRTGRQAAIADASTHNKNRGGQQCAHRPQ